MLNLVRVGCVNTILVSTKATKMNSVTVVSINGSLQAGVHSHSAYI